MIAGGILAGLGVVFVVYLLFKAWLALDSWLVDLQLDRKELLRLQDTVRELDRNKVSDERFRSESSYRDLSRNTIWDKIHSLDRQIAAMAPKKRARK